MLTDNQKRTGLDILSSYEGNPDDFIEGGVTQDETQSQRYKVNN